MNIMLPDSGRDEPNSHGFVSYRIETNTGIVDEVFTAPDGSQYLLAAYSDTSQPIRVLPLDAAGRAERHFVIMCFASRWIAGEPQLNEELADARWVEFAELADYKTTEGLAPIVAAAFDVLKTAG